jgi:hypothetical protein
MRNRFHALCPYFAMFPESFAEHWIGRLAPPGSVVLDPFCGRGTTAFQALLMNRRALAVDVNPVAACVTKAKTNAPARDSVMRRLRELREVYEGAPDGLEREVSRLPEFFRAAYQRETRRQIVFLRANLKWETSATDCMIAALVLGALHGESQKSPAYLSNQMPRTISTKPAYSIRFWHRHKMKAPKRNAFDVLKAATGFRYESQPPRRRGTVLRMDMRDLPRHRALPVVRTVITSPPYLDVTNFEEDQWLRLWFLGGPPHPTYGLVSRDDRLETVDEYWSLIGDFWRTVGQVVEESGNVVLRIGAKGLRPQAIVDGVVGTGVLSGRRLVLREWSVSEIRRRQTDSFRPGSKGCMVEVDCHLQFVG